MSAHHIFITPFADYGFMRRALVSCICLGVGSGPVGLFLMLRRMSLVGDALSHAVLPGAAIGYVVAGSLSLFAMGVGGLVAGLFVALMAGLVSRGTELQEDASFASFYLTSLALGVLIISLRGSNIDLLHVLFGSILAINADALYQIGIISSISMLTLAVIYRPLVVECFDAGFLQAVGGRGLMYHTIFLILVVLNLVASFQALGTLMAVGLMMLPAAIAQLWSRRLPVMMVVSATSAIAASYFGLVISYQFATASGPTIIVTAAAIYVVSIVFAPLGMARRFFPRSHFAG